MKQCSSCRDYKPLVDFYRHPEGSFGRMHICKQCHKSRVKLRAKINPAVQEYNRMRAKTPERIELNTRITRRWREKYPEAYRAQNAVNNAIRDGKLKREPCSICSNTRVHAHHKDYTKPLDVIWLCARCHHRLHATFPELSGHRGASP